MGATVADGKSTLLRASAVQMGTPLDALFRVGLGIRPFDGESDHAVGAEW